jgi:hypothetical protein
MDASAMGFVPVWGSEEHIRMQQKSHEQTRSPREQLARKWSLVRRGLMYWKGALLVLLVGGTAALVGAWKVKHVYRSECTVLAKPHFRTDDRDESPTSAEQVARQAARLKDMLTTRARLEGAIRKFGLYPLTLANKTILDAVEEMKPHVGFRSLEGAQYVISFDGDDPDRVLHVTQYLSESLIGDYAAGDLDDVRREAEFLAGEEKRSLSGLEDATKALTIFLASHPEFAVEAKHAAQTPFGPSPAAGIPLMPAAARGAPTSADPELNALYRERARLDSQARTAAAVSRDMVSAAPSSKPLDEQIAQAQAEVEGAAKRVAETAADLASKSNLTEDHPDMRAARMAADAAARHLHEAKVKLGALQQIKASGSSASAATTTPLPAEVTEKLKQIDSQIAVRRAELARAPSTADGETPLTKLASSPAMDAVVALETDWQRLLRALNEAKAHHDELKLRGERAKLALEASRAQASERMAIVDPPFRPTHPSKGGRTNFAIAGLAMALLLAIAYGTVRVSMDDTLIDAEDIEVLALAPVLGVVPKIQQDAALKEICPDAAE